MIQKKLTTVFIIFIMFPLTASAFGPRQIGLCAWKTFQLWLLTREVKKWCKEKEKKKLAFIAGTAAIGTYDGNSALSWYHYGRDSLRKGEITIKLPQIIKPIDWHQVRSHPIEAATSCAFAASEGIEKAFLLLATMKAYEKLISNGWLKRSCWLTYHGVRYLFGI